MNREIKFRAWDKTRARFHYGCSNLFLDMGGTFWWQFGFDRPEPISKEDFVLQQFTGLKDKNGKEIYEGDIIRELMNPGHCIWEVKYKPSYFTAEDKSHRFPLFSLNYGYEIIGNIYENPELLEK